MKKYYYADSCIDVINPVSPINIDNYSNLCEPVDEHLKTLNLRIKKGYLYVLVPNNVKDIKIYDLSINAYSVNPHPIVIDNTIPEHLVYKFSSRPYYGGNVQLEFIYD